MSLAASRASALTMMLQSRRSGTALATFSMLSDCIRSTIGADGAGKSPPSSTPAAGGVDKSSDAYRRVEQLVVYVRALHMLSSALQLAQQHVADKTLHPSAAVRTGERCRVTIRNTALRCCSSVLSALNERYHVCLCRAQELVSLGLPGNEAQLALVSAERLMYNHALELCQTAALDELFGNPQLVRRTCRYLAIVSHWALVAVLVALPDGAHVVALPLAAGYQRRRQAAAQQM